MSNKAKVKLEMPVPVLYVTRLTICLSFRWFQCPSPESLHLYRKVYQAKGSRREKWAVSQSPRPNRERNILRTAPPCHPTWSEREGNRKRRTAIKRRGGPPRSATQPGFTHTCPWAAVMMRVRWRMKIWEKSCISWERSERAEAVLGLHLLKGTVRIKICNVCFSLLDTSKRWCLCRHSRTRNCRSCTDSYALLKTTDSLCRCPGPHLSPTHPSPSPHADPDPPKSSSGPDPTLTWITMESHIKVLISDLSWIHQKIQIHLLHFHVATTWLFFFF